MTLSSKPLLFGLALLSFTAPAAASTTFPEALRMKLGLAQIAGPGPGCQLCHRDDLGGLKTATKPLGRSLLKEGAMGGSVPSLLAALTALQADHIDSDGDGVDDIDELKAGTDPNVAEDGATSTIEQVPLPETGCSLSGASQHGTAGTWLSIAGLLFAWARRRRG